MAEGTFVPGSALSQAQQLLNKTQESGKTQGNEVEPIEYIRTVIRANQMSTLRFSLNDHDHLIIETRGLGAAKVVDLDFSVEEFWDMCDEFDITRDEEYNCSRSLVIGGVSARVFALMPPLCSTPIVTISTTKPPKLANRRVDPKLLEQILRSNTIFVGPSGSGKTYLLNELLNEFIKEEDSIGMIEEFAELVPPNSSAVRVIIPPYKPGEEPLLRFALEMSNLMRFERIVIGEIKGPEALPFITNLASGTKGLATLHGDDERYALQRLRILASFGARNPISEDAINSLIAQAIEYIVVMRKHKIVSISKLNGVVHNSVFQMDKIL